MESSGSIRRQSTTQHPLKELDSAGSNPPQEGKNGVKTHDPQARIIPEARPSSSESLSLKDRAITKPDTDDVASTRPPVTDTAEGASNARTVSAEEIVEKLIPLYQKLPAPEQVKAKKRSLKKRAASFIKSVTVRLKRSKSVPDLSKTSELKDIKSPNRLTRSQSAPELPISQRSSADTPYSPAENPLKSVIEQLQPLQQKAEDSINAMYTIINSSSDKRAKTKAINALPELTAAKLQIEESLYALHTLTPANQAEQEQQLVGTPKEHQKALDKALKHLPKDLLPAESTPAPNTSIEGDDEYPDSSPAGRPHPPEQETSFTIPTDTRPEKQSDQTLTRLARNNSHLASTRGVLDGQLDDIERKVEELNKLLAQSKNKKSKQLAHKAIRSLQHTQERVQLSLAAANEATANSSPALLTKLVGEPRLHQKNIDKVTQELSAQMPNIQEFRPVANHEHLGRMESLQQLENQVSELKGKIEVLSAQHESASNAKESKAAKALLASQQLQELESQINLATTHLQNGDPVHWKKLTLALNQVNKQITKSKLYTTPTTLRSVLLVSPAK